MLKRPSGNGDAGRAPAYGAPARRPTPPRTPEERAMRLQQLKHMVDEDAYRVEPQAVAVALLMRVDPRRDLFTGLLTRPDARSPEGPAAPSGRAG